MRRLVASTIYEVIIALVIFVIVSSISFFTIFKIAVNIDRKNTLKYENMVTEFKQNKSDDVVVEKAIYLYSNKFIWNKYIVLSSSGDTLYVKNELQYIQDED